MAENILVLTDGDFQAKVLDSDKPVVVDFWAPWCGPCKMLTPVVEELAGEYGGRMTFAKIDIAQHSEAAARFGIRSIPALLFFKGGQVVETMIGAQPKENVKDRIEKVLG